MPSTELSTCLCTRKQILCLWRPSRSFCIDSWVFIMLDSICQARNNFKSSSWNSTPFELLTIFEYFPEFIFQVNNFFKDTPFKSTVDTFKRNLYFNDVRSWCQTQQWCTRWYRGLIKLVNSDVQSSIFTCHSCCINAIGKSISFLKTLFESSNSSMYPFI